MDFTDFQFGNVDPEFDFTSDITGSACQQPLFEEPIESGLPDNFWFQNPSAGSLISNNDLPGRAENKFGDQVRLNENQNVIKKVYLMAMRGLNALELERTLKLSFSHEDFNSNPLLRNSLFILPLVGPVFWACWPFKSEEEARLELRRKKEIKPVFVSECSECRSCQYRNALSAQKIFCSKLGLPIFNNEFSEPPPKSILDHLRRAEYLTINKSGYSWDDVRSAAMFHQKKDTRQVYNQSTPVKKDVLQGAQYRLAVRELNLLQNDKRVQAESYKRHMFIQNTCYPIIIRVQEIVLRNCQNDIASNDSLSRIYLPTERKPALEDLVRSLSNDIYLWSKLRWYPQPYTKCDDALRFLRRTMIKVPFAVQRQECQTCMNNKNGYCALLETTLVSYYSEIPEQSRLSAIDKIGFERNIDQNMLAYLKNQERSNPKMGLNRLREVLNTHRISQVYSGAGIQDLDKIPNSKEKSEKVNDWIGRKIDERCSIIKIENAVVGKYGEKKGQKMIQEILLSKKVFPTGSNDLCLTNYELSPGSSIGKIDKCTTCPNADSLYCKKYNRVFITSSNEIPSEVNEIQSYFQDRPTEINVQIDPVRAGKPLDVEMENPGELLSVDVRTEKNIDEDALWFETQQQEMEVEAPEVMHFENPLDIDLGEQGAGMVLGDDLL